MRILDFPHAAEHLSAAGQLVFGEGTAQAQSWLATQLHTLKHAGPPAVLGAVQDLIQQCPDTAALTTHLAYLEKRVAHMQYPVFQREGWPIGDGAVESGNKLVVEARMKGAGMHWARSHVNPMLSLRDVLCSERWDEDWPQIVRQLRQQQWAVREQRRQGRLAQRRRSRPDDLPAPAPVAPPARRVLRRKPTRPVGKAHPPADNHPWRHMPIGRAILFPRKKHSSTKI